MKHFSATYIKCLKDAVSTAFWYKNELREFLASSISDKRLVTGLDWKSGEKSKRGLVDDIFTLMENGGTFVADIDCLTRGMLEMTRYPSLERLEDSEKRLAAAKAARKALRKCADEHKKAFESGKKYIEYDFLKAEFERRKREDDERTRRREEDDSLREDNPDKYYGRILKLKGKITKEQIKAKYRDLIKLYHPDKFSTLDEEFVELATTWSQKITEAYQFLCDRYGIE